MLSKKSRLSIVILGSGPTAMGAAYRLNQLIESKEIDREAVDVTVIEKEHIPGGLARSITDDKGFTWDLGIHISGASKYPCFLEAIEQAVPTWNRIRRCVMADMSHVFAGNGLTQSERGCHYVPYPVQQSIPYFPDRLKVECIKDLKRTQTTEYSQKPKNFAEYTRRMFGENLQRIFIRPYNEKVWTVKMEEMNTEWVEGRVPPVDVADLEMRSLKPRKQMIADDQRKPFSWFRYPGNCKGVGATWTGMKGMLPDKWFRFNEEAIDIDSNMKKVICRNTKTKTLSSHEYDLMLSTIPITELGKLSHLTGNVQLKHSKVFLVGLGCTQPQPEWTKSISWIYFASPQLIFYRCTFMSHFSRDMTPDADVYWSVLCEIGARHDEHIEQQHLIQQTIQGLLRSEVLSDVSQVTDEWSCMLPFGYPIPTLNRDEELRRVHGLLETQNIYSRGRFGGWKYEIANQDHSFAMGYQLVDRWFRGHDETVYHTGLSTDDGCLLTDGDVLVTAPDVCTVYHTVAYPFFVQTTSVGTTETIINNLWARKPKPSSVSDKVAAGTHIVQLKHSVNNNTLLTPSVNIFVDDKSINGSNDLFVQKTLKVCEEDLRICTFRSLSSRPDSFQNCQVKTGFISDIL